jgi:TolB-like protein
MELVSGVPITEYCDTKRLSVRARLELFVAVCQAVQHAHQKGIIHRDLKPSNVMVTEVDGRPTPKVIDFGVAKATEFSLTDQSLADTGAIVGTPTYMSPEQADPSSMDIDTRTDVYALGVILYELLSGRNPFLRDSNVATLASILRDDPPPIPGVSQALTVVIERCLRKARDHRYPDAGHLLTALDTAATPGDRSLPFVAVLPFVNLSADPDNEYFCDGLSEEILNLLAGTRDLRVIARTSAFAWKGKSDDIRTIGAKLGVDCVLEGSVRRQGDRLREAGRLRPHEPVQRLFVEEHGDAEAGVVLRPPLDRVGELRLGARPVAVAGALDPFEHLFAEEGPAVDDGVAGRLLVFRRRPTGAEPLVTDPGLCAGKVLERQPERFHFSPRSEREAYRIVVESVQRNSRSGRVG